MRVELLYRKEIRRSIENNMARKDDVDNVVHSRVKCSLSRYMHPCLEGIIICTRELKRGKAKKKKKVSVLVGIIEGLEYFQLYLNVLSSSRISTHSRRRLV